MNALTIEINSTTIEIVMNYCADKFGIDLSIEDVKRIFSYQTLVEIQYPYLAFRYRDSDDWKKWYESEYYNQGKLESTQEQKVHADLTMFVGFNITCIEIEDLERSSQYLLLAMKTYKDKNITLTEKMKNYFSIFKLVLTTCKGRKVDVYDWTLIDGNLTKKSL